MSLDRTIAPPLKPIEQASLIEPEKFVLTNGLPLYVISGGTQEVCRIEVVYNTGTVHGKKLYATYANALMKEGTTSYTSEQIAETLDFYGAYLDEGTDKFNSHYILYALNKHLPSVLDVFSEIIHCPVFPEKEFEIYHQTQYQNFKINLQKVEFIARSRFPSLLVGPSHPYGRIIEETDYKQLSLTDIKQFFDLYYKNNISYILVSGKISTKEIELISKKFQKIKKTQSTENINTDYWISSPTNFRKQFIPKEDALQSAIRIGRMLFTKRHPDFISFQVLNTILGGYFGSRLMTNIREDKGYTYGIGSVVHPYLKDGIFFISTEVGVNVTRAAIEEIYKELKKLREEYVSDEELTIVKNYMLGSFLRHSDGPFAQAGRFRAVYDYGLDYSYYQNFFKTIHQITPQMICELANKYLREEDLFELVVGKM